MGRRRGILTDHEREMIAEEDPEQPNRRYLAISRVRTKIWEQMPEDIEILAEHHPDLLEELREVVCEEPEARAPEAAARSDDD